MSSSQNQPNNTATTQATLEARGFDVEALELSCPELAEVATNSIAEAVKAEANANFGQALELLQQAKSQLMLASRREQGSTPIRREAIGEAMDELDARIDALVTVVQGALERAGLRCPLFSNLHCQQPEDRCTSANPIVAWTPSCHTPSRGLHSSKSSHAPVTPQERRLRMEEVNGARKRLEANPNPRPPKKQDR